jgi:hypothetical protein
MNLILLNAVGDELPDNASPIRTTELSMAAENISNP